MTDLDRLLAFLDGANHDYAREGAGTYRRHYGPNTDLPHATLIRLDEGVGYWNFECCFYFDTDGKLLDHGVWE